MNTDKSDNRPFAPGDTVQLRSGGPVMTVNTIQGDQVNVAWFDDTGLKRATFSQPQLTRSEPGSYS